MSDEDLVRVEHLAKKFCRDLKTSLWYGVQDLGAPLRQGIGDGGHFEEFGGRPVRRQLCLHQGKTDGDEHDQGNGDGRDQ